MQFKRLVASQDAILTGQYKINKVRLVSTSGAGSAILYNSLAQSGGIDFCTLGVDATGDSDREDFGKDMMTTKESGGLSATLTGSVILYIYYS